MSRPQTGVVEKKPPRKIFSQPGRCMYTAFPHSPELKEQQGNAPKSFRSIFQIKYIKRFLWLQFLVLLLLVSNWCMRFNLNYLFHLNCTRNIQTTTQKMKHVSKCILSTFYWQENRITYFMTFWIIFNKKYIWDNEQEIMGQKGSELDQKTIWDRLELIYRSILVLVEVMIYSNKANTKKGNTMIFFLLNIYHGSNSCQN